MLFFGNLLLPLLILPLPAVSADDCACIAGTVPSKVTTSLASGNNGTTELVGILRTVVRGASSCRRELWAEAFVLGAAWEASHIALGRHSSQLPEKYFVFPTYCSASRCVDYRIDWLKNALWDTVQMYAVGLLAQVSDGSAGRVPKEWLWLEELIDNALELGVDLQNNGVIWTVCFHNNPI